MRNAGRTNPGNYQFSWNIPNALTLLRLFLVPVQVKLLLDERIGWAFALYFFAAVTDGLDGYFARKKHQRTLFGAALDPLVDKVTVLSTFVTLVAIDVIPLWLAGLVVARDALIVFGAWLLYMMRRRIPWRPIAIGKTTTVFQYATVLAAMLNHFYYFPGIVFRFLVAATAILTVFSWIAYIRLWFQIHGQELEKGAKS